MIESLYKKHNNKVIAIVGSGPTARMFNSEACDISIAVNGAALLPTRFNYFMCGDVKSPKRSWFYVDCAPVRLIFKKISSLDYQLYPKNQFKIKRKVHSYRYLKKADFLQPLSPHLTFDYSFDKTVFFKGVRKFSKLTAGSTVVGLAVQLAFLMGCKEIQLYGCGFTVETSKIPKHYLLKTQDDIGWLTEEQIKEMNLVLNVVRQAGVKVTVFGETALSEFDEQCVGDYNFLKSNQLILGSAGQQAADATTLDCNAESKPDVVHDLNEGNLPFKDNQFFSITAHHVLEHLRALDFLMEELYRICHPNGKIFIEVPHHTSWCANTPEHCLRFNYFSFDGYLNSPYTVWMKGRKFELVHREITFHRSFRRVMLQRLFNKFPMSYERFWTYIFPAEFLKVCLRPVK